MTSAEINYPDPGFWTKTSLIQLGYGVWVNLSMVAIGLAFGFPAVTVPQLSSDSDIHVSVADESWIGLYFSFLLLLVLASVISLASPFGCVISGYLIDKIGRRIMMITTHIPVFIGWIYTGFAASSKHIIIGRTLTGFGIGMVMSVPRPYMTEMSLPNMRGVIGSFPNIAMSVGITLQAGLGSFLKWTTLCYLSGCYAIVLSCLNYFLPETPYYLLTRDTMENAENSLRKFRSSTYNINAEMAQLLDFKLDNAIHKFSLKERVIALFQPSACKPFFIMMNYFMITQLSGTSIIIMWGVEIIQKSKSSVDPNTGNFLLASTRILAGVITSTIIFRVGRRPLAVISSIGVGLICISLGSYIHYAKELSVLPQIGYMAYIALATLGHYTLPVLIMFELYPLQIRGVLGGISISIINFFIFGVNKCYPYIRDSLGFAYIIISFGVSSLLGAIYLYFYLPETKDLTLQEIEEYFNDRRPTLTSQRRLMSMQLSKQVLSKNDTASRSLVKILSDRYKKERKKDNMQAIPSSKDVSTSTDSGRK